MWEIARGTEMGVIARICQQKERRTRMRALTLPPGAVVASGLFGGTAGAGLPGLTAALVVFTTARGVAPGLLGLGSGSGSGRGGVLLWLRSGRPRGVIYDISMRTHEGCWVAMEKMKR
jgi:hypothetical protein